MSSSLLLFFCSSLPSCTSIDLASTSHCLSVSEVFSSQKLHWSHDGIPSSCASFVCFSPFFEKGS
jgi:hypothetical protein